MDNKDETIRNKGPDAAVVASPLADGAKGDSKQEDTDDEQLSELDLQTIKNSAINNGTSSLQLALLNKKNTLIWHYHQFKTRLVVVLAIKDMIYKGIKAFANVGNINTTISSIQPIWVEFSPSEPYQSSTSISRLEEFITCFVL